MNRRQLRPQRGVPWVASWSGERSNTALLEATPRGLLWWNESPRDRDRYGALWARKTKCVGAGKPIYEEMHPLRQRMAMERLLCQVCGGDADSNDDGVLWLEPVTPGDPLRPHTTHPPLCVPCAVESMRRCPRLRRTGAHAVRARSEPWGVYGMRYALDGTGRPVPREPAFADYTDPLIRWVLATQRVVELHGITRVNLDDGYTRHTPARPGTAARTPDPT